MNRRRVLETTGVGLAALLAGCNRLGTGGETPTETVTNTPTNTETGTPTDTEEPTLTENKPVNVTKPAYLDPLPKRHLKGTENTPDSFFLRLDWEWYLQHYDTPMRFGKASEAEWTLEANAGNLVDREPPAYAPLQTPVGAAIQEGKLIAKILPQFPNLGPELVQQCGFEMVTESGTSESRAEYVGPNAASCGPSTERTSPRRRAISPPPPTPTTPDT